MTSFDKMVATDLAALGFDSRQRIGAFEPLAFAPTPKVAIVARVPDPVRSRVNRIAAIAAGGTSLLCAGGLAKATILPAFVMDRHHEISRSWIVTNGWLLGFAAVAIVAAAFLLAHRLAAHVLQGASEWRTRAQRLGDIAFGITAVAWVIGWFVVMFDVGRTWHVLWGSRWASIYRGLYNDVRGETLLVLAGGLACSLTARAIAVSAAAQLHDRWSGASVAVFAKLAGLVALATVCLLPEFGANGSWTFWHDVHVTSPLLQIRGAVFEVMRHMLYGPDPWHGDWMDSEQTTILISAALALGLAALLALLCFRERYTDRRSRSLATLEHRYVLASALVVAFVGLVTPMFVSQYAPVAPLTTAGFIALAIVAISTTLRRRRGSLAQIASEPSR